MATQKKTLETFNIQANLKLQVSVQIEAKDFYEAIEKMKELTVQDFVTIEGDYDDGEIVGFEYIGSNDYQKGFKLK